MSPSTDPLSPPKTQENGRSHMVLPGLLLITASSCLYLGTNLWSTRNEVKLLRQELRSTQAVLKSAQLRVEADQVIIHRQLEMLRAAQEPAPKSAP